MPRRLFALALLLIAAPATADTPGRRVALVIANSAYARIDPLRNPVADGKLVAAALTKAGFAVDVRDNLDLSHFLQALRDFRGQADGAEVALVYYAGHGVQADGENYLVPTDAEMAAAPDLQFEAVGLERLMATLGGARMRVAILDACRDNPFRSAAAVARAASGLAQIDVDDVLLIYSAAPGKQAADGAGANSPFATALAGHINQPGLPIQLLGGVVRDDVIKATASAQRPFISASVTGTPYYLVAPPRGFALAGAGGGVPSGGGQAGAARSMGRTARSNIGGMMLGPRPGTTGSWVASDPKLPMARVAVERMTDGADYVYTVTGNYPLALRSGKLAPQARVIRVIPRLLRDGAALPVKGARKTRIGLWNPGDAFTTSFRYPKADIDGSGPIELRLCMGEGTEGATGFCFWSPNLIKDGPQQLLPARLF